MAPDTIFLLVVVFICFVTDVLYRKMPNLVTLPAIVVGFGYNLLGGWPALKISLLGFSIGFGFFLFFWFLGGMAEGDVKLMGAIGAIKGYPFIVLNIFYISILAGVMAICKLIWQERFFSYFRENWRYVFRQDKIYKHEDTVPFGVAIMAGTCIALVKGGYL